MFIFVRLLFWYIHYLSFQRIISLNFLCDYSEVDTPGPIPNPAVKHFSADDSESENRTLQSFFCYKIFLFINLFIINLEFSDFK